MIALKDKQCFSALFVRSDSVVARVLPKNNTKNPNETQAVSSDANVLSAMYHVDAWSSLERNTDQRPIRSGEHEQASTV